MCLVNLVSLLHKLFITKTCPCNIQRCFSAVIIENFIGGKKDIFNIFVQNMDSVYVLMSTHNLRFRSIIRKIGIPLCNSVLLYKSGGLMGYTLHVMSYSPVSTLTINAFVHGCVSSWSLLLFLRVKFTEP